MSTAMDEFISSSCSVCGAKFRVPADQAGKTGKCKQCGELIKVPMPDSSSILVSITESGNHPKLKKAAQIPTGTVLSVMAIVLSTASLVLTLLRPTLPGTSLKSYDISTPHNAVRSQMEMQARADFRAGMELERAKVLSNSNVDLDSIHIERTIEHDGKAAVFVSYKDGGLDKYSVTWVERAKDGSKAYFTTYVSTYGWDSGDKKQIKEMIDKWEATGKLQ